MSDQLFIDWEIENNPRIFDRPRSDEFIDRRTLTHVIGNVDRPDSVTPQAFQDVMERVAETLDKFPYFKMPEPRVMTLEELKAWDGAFLLEYRAKTTTTVWASYYADYEHYGETMCRMIHIDGEVDDRSYAAYGTYWRCWTGRPTDERRETEQWD